MQAMVRRTLLILNSALTSVAMAGCYGSVAIGIGDDPDPPSVGLSATPAQVAQAGDVTLSATISAERPIVEVRFYERTAQGVNLLASDTAPPFDVTFPVDARDNGTLQFYATAYDTGGLSGDSATLLVPVAIP